MATEFSDCTDVEVASSSDPNYPIVNIDENNPAPALLSESENLVLITKAESVHVGNIYIGCTTNIYNYGGNKQLTDPYRNATLTQTALMVKGNDLQPNDNCQNLKCDSTRETVKTEMAFGKNAKAELELAMRLLEESEDSGKAFRDQINKIVYSSFKW